MTTKPIQSIGNANKSLTKLTVSLVAVAVIVVALTAAWLWHGLKGSELSLLHDDAIDATPTIVDGMRGIGQWEFLTLHDEEIIDTVRTGFFSDDELVRIYYGTLRLGIDLSQCSEDWIDSRRDTIVVTIPRARLLDHNFIDEARTTSFFETGKWSNADRQAMYDQARQKMMARCMTQDNISRATTIACQQIQRFLASTVQPRQVKVITEKSK